MYLKYLTELEDNHLIAILTSKLIIIVVCRHDAPKQRKCGSWKQFALVCCSVVDRVACKRVIVMSMLCQCRAGGGACRRATALRSAKPVAPHHRLSTCCDCVVDEWFFLIPSIGWVDRCFSSEATHQHLWITLPYSFTLNVIDNW